MRLHAHAAVLAAAAGLAACGGGASTLPSASEFALIAQALDGQLNEPVRSLHANLSRANSDGEVYAHEVLIAATDENTPADWWVYEQGYMRYGGASQFLGYFVLTPEGEAFVKGPVPKLLASRFQAPPEAACNGTRTFTSCTVSGVVLVEPTAQAGDRLKGAPAAPQPIQADLEYTKAQGWKVTGVRLASGRTAAAVGQDAILGDREAAAAARARFATVANRLGG